METKLIWRRRERRYVGLRGRGRFLGLRIRRDLCGRRRDVIVWQTAENSALTAPTLITHKSLLLSMCIPSLSTWPVLGRRRWKRHITLSNTLKIGIVGVPLYGKTALSAFWRKSVCLRRITPSVLSTPM